MNCDNLYAANTGHYATKCGKLAPMIKNLASQILAQKVLVLHGPNLNLLGKREPQHYGNETLEDINHNLVELACASGTRIEIFQSNAEHCLIERIHTCLYDETTFIIINPAAFTHTSIAIRDALSAVNIPFIEVHLSNVHARESFRHHSYFSDLATAVICGLGAEGYYAAYRYIQQR